MPSRIEYRPNAILGGISQIYQQNAARMEAEEAASRQNRRQENFGYAQLGVQALGQFANMKAQKDMQAQHQANALARIEAEQSSREALIDYKQKIQDTEYYHTPAQLYRMDEINDWLAKIDEADYAGDIFAWEAETNKQQLLDERNRIMSNPARRPRQKPKFPKGQGVGQVWNEQGYVWTRNEKGIAVKQGEFRDPNQPLTEDEYDKLYLQLAKTKVPIEKTKENPFGGERLMRDDEIRENIGKYLENKGAFFAPPAQEGVPPMLQRPPGQMPPIPGAGMGVDARQAPGAGLPGIISPQSAQPQTMLNRNAGAPPPTGSQQHMPQIQGMQDMQGVLELMQDDNAPAKVLANIQDKGADPKASAQTLHQWVQADPSGGRLRRAKIRWAALMKKGGNLEDYEQREMWMLNAMLTGKANEWR